MCFVDLPEIRKRNSKCIPVWGIHLHTDKERDREKESEGKGERKAKLIHLKVGEQNEKNQKSEVNIYRVYFRE